jgi:hypothetical protein
VNRRGLLKPELAQLVRSGIVVDAAEGFVAVAVTAHDVVPPDPALMATGMAAPASNTCTVALAGMPCHLRLRPGRRERRHRLSPLLAMVMSCAADS